MPRQVSRRLKAPSCGTSVENCPCSRIQTKRSYASRAYLLVRLRGKIMKESTPTEPTTKRAAIYARFSTELQNERSIEDQIALCQSYAQRERLNVVCTYE